MVSHSSAFTSIRAHASRLKCVADAHPSRILVVDDEPSVVTFAERVLRDAGYQTAHASDGPDALRTAANAGPFDLLLTDLLMPQMCGDELARRLRQQEPDLKVLYLTGYSDLLFQEKTILWQDEAFLDKPCSVKGLLEGVSLLLYDHLLAEESLAKPH